MKREFLEGLGLNKETVDKIMTENEADIEREKSKTAQAKTDLSDAQKQLANLKAAAGNTEEVKKQLEALQAETEQYKAQLAERDYADAITRGISGKGVKFSSKAAERDFIATLKEKKLELKDGELTGLDDFIKSQREADPGAFAPDKEPPRFITGGDGGGHSAPGGVRTPAELMAEAIGKASAESGKNASNIISMYTGGKT